MPFQHPGSFNIHFFINAVALFVVFNATHITIDYGPFNLSPGKPIQKTITSKQVEVHRENSPGTMDSRKQDYPSIADMHELNECGKIIFIIKQ